MKELTSSLPNDEDIFVKLNHLFFRWSLPNLVLVLLRIPSEALFNDDKIPAAATYASSTTLKSSLEAFTLGLSDGASDKPARILIGVSFSGSFAMVFCRLTKTALKSSRLRQRMGSSGRKQGLLGGVRVGVKVVVWAILKLGRSFSRTGFEGPLFA